MGVYGSSTFFQGQPVTPDAHPAPASSSCTELTSIGNGLVAVSSSVSASASIVSIHSYRKCLELKSYPSLQTPAPTSAGSIGSSISASPSTSVSGGSRSSNSASSVVPNLINKLVLVLALLGAPAMVFHERR